jgi:hypothetical protein
MSAAAELKQVDIGGEVRIRGRYYRNAFNEALPGVGNRALRWPTPTVFKRALGPFGLTSIFDFDNRGANLSFVEQRTVVNVKAHFTEDVSAFFELSSYDQWGEDFRSNYVTGNDLRSATGNDVEIFQAYIDADQMAGYPLRLRMGRQELTFGKGWLYGSRSTPLLAISYDGIRATYSPENFVIDAWWAKLAETSPLEEDGDVDYYGLYGTYSGFEALSLSAHYSLIRDGRAVVNTRYGIFFEEVEDLLGVDQYDPTYLHTVGLRAFGDSGAWDYDAEVAYQFGEADAVGGQYLLNLYGDDGAEFDHFGADLEVGYTIDMAWQPRIYLGGAYLDGEDNREISFWQWLNPFYIEPEASMAFNRLFSAFTYSQILDLVGSGKSMSNFWQARGGVQLHPTEKISASLDVAYLETVDPFDHPRHWWSNHARQPIFPILSFWTQESDKEIGTTAHLSVTYNYSADWSTTIGWEHLFTGDGSRDGSFLQQNGHSLMAGTDDDDADYWYWHTVVRF